MDINKEIEQEAEKYASYKMVNGEHVPLFYKINEEKKIHFINGATSDSTKEYWYKQFEKEKIEYAINELNQLIDDMGHELAVKHYKPVHVRIRKLKEKLNNM